VPISHPSVIDARLFLTTFTMVALAEIPDKTALAAMVLGTGTRPFAVFVGVAAAFVIQSLVAVTCGSLLSLCPPLLVRIGSGGLFVAFALAMWLRSGPKDGGDAHPHQRWSGFWRTVLGAFLVIFVAEWGDLTQLATAALAAKRAAPVTIFVAATLALWLVSAVAITLGNRMRDLIPVPVIQRLAAVLFLAIGVLILCGLSLGSGV
jgi:putative Ca2+/H+ antiporter (TMEM165/GDT1 family)